MKLPRGRAPNYRLKAAYSGLEEGTFVRPVELYHLPSHIRKDINPWFDTVKEVWCYTSKGFICLPRELLEET